MDGSDLECSDVAGIDFVQGDFDPHPHGFWDGWRIMWESSRLSQWKIVHTVGCLKRKLGTVNSLERVFPRCFRSWLSFLYDWDLIQAAEQHNIYTTATPHLQYLAQYKTYFVEFWMGRCYYQLR